MAIEYETRDHSLLAPILRRVVWLPVLSRVPTSVSANSLTLLGTTASAAAFLVALFLPPNRITTASMALLIFGYLTLDNIDGAQARRTNTSSPLGELLDHWLDSVNCVFLFVGGIVVWAIPEVFAVPLLASAVLAYALTFWEQRVTGRIHMARFGNVEGIFAVFLFYVLSTIADPIVLRSTTLVLDRTAIDWFVLVSIVGSTVTAIATVVRARRDFATVIEIVLPVAAVSAGFVLAWVPFAWAIAWLMILSPSIAGRMLIGHVTEAKRVFPDRWWTAALVLAVAVSGAIELPALVRTGLYAAVTGQGLVTTAVDFVRAVRQLRHHLREEELLAKIF